MAGSTPESDLAGGAARLAPAASEPVRTRRWKVLRRAARARLAPFGAAVMVLAGLVALAAPPLPPDLPLAPNLRHTPPPPRGHPPPRPRKRGPARPSPVGWGTRTSQPC